jgi:hypothetical protein
MIKASWPVQPPAAANVLDRPVRHQPEIYAMMTILTILTISFFAIGFAAGMVTSYLSVRREFDRRLEGAQRCY